MGDQEENDSSGVEDGPEVRYCARQYQEELFEIACKSNTIICLKTGAGKTFIAIMLIKEYQHEIRKPYALDGKRTFFLVPKVALVSQQANAIRTHTILKVGEYRGADGVDKWDKLKWKSELEQNEVLVMTAQILLNMLTVGFIPLHKVNLLIFDECHMATGNYAYCTIMSRYKDSMDPPRILGLTASILNKKCNPCSVERDMKKLENVLYSHIQTARDLDVVNRYATKPKEMIIVCDPLSSAGAVEGSVKEILDRATDFMKPILDSQKAKKSGKAAEEPNVLETIKRMKSFSEIYDVLRNIWEDEDAGSSEMQEFGSSPDVMLKYVMVIFYTLGLWCTKYAVDTFLEDIPRQRTAAEEQLKENHLVLYDILQVALAKVQQVLDRYFNSLPKGNSIMTVSPRVERLTELLSALRPPAAAAANDDAPPPIEFRGIVFVQQRIIAWILTEYLQELSKCRPEKFGYLHPCYIVGHGVNVSFMKNSSMNVSKQTGILHSFRSGACNLMVATQVVEEGLDIPKCNAVIRFDPPRNFTSYVQSMGRARAEKALYILLVDPANKSELMNDITVYKMVECILNLKSHNRAPPTEEEGKLFFQNFHLMPPYYPGTRDGAVITLNTALEVLYRYCNHLPRDRYTVLGPKFRYSKKEDDLTMVRCSITLPFGALIREPIAGEHMSDKKTARKAAAYAACIKLHERGELNEHLMPSLNYIQRYQEKLGIIPMESHKEGVSMPGTKKRRRVYEKEIPEDFSDCSPSCERNLYLYAICIDSTEPDETVGTEHRYGILTSKLITSVCPFTLYGKTVHTVKIQLVKSNWTVNNFQLNELQTFHCFLFQYVLHLATEAMEYCPRAAKFSFLIVPIKELYSEVCIDWDLITICKRHERSPDEAGDPLSILPKAGDVVMPQYGDGQAQNRRFYVVRVCHELSPASPFSSQYGSYADYFKLKYNKNVTNPRQPLLLVDYIPNTLNVLHPALAGNSMARKKRQQHQIPEFCKLFPLSIQHVSQAFFVPSILHRLSGLLLARQLRDRIIAEANLPLEIDFQCDALPLLEAACTDCKIEDETIFSSHFGACFGTDPTALGALVFQALTTSSADNWSDLERLEVVGDSFLKFSVSVYLYCTISNVNEGGLSTLRTGMVKNFNLYSHARAKGIPALLNAAMFQPRLMWLPPGFRFPLELRYALMRAEVQRHLWLHALPEDVVDFRGDDEAWSVELTKRWSATDPVHRETALGNPAVAAASGSSDSSFDDGDSPACVEGSCDHFVQQLIGDKTVADASEALIGAVLLFCGQNAALYFLEWLGLKLEPGSYPWPRPSTALVMELPADKLQDIYIGLDDLEDQLRYRFKEKSFLRQALVHPSCTRHPATDNYQRLEFLGDAILDFLVTMHLYKMHPGLSPGDMTDLRSSLVDNVTFGYLTVKHELHKHLKYCSQNLYQAIDRYIKHAESMTDPKDVVYLCKEDETLELEEIEIPKALGDVFEAIAGAIFIDSGLSLEAVWKVYYPMMRSVIDQYSSNLPINPIRQLMEKYPQTTFSKPVKNEDIFTITVLCDGKTYCGRSKKKTFAKQAAAKSALRALNIPSTRAL